jgi:hypothetical protein
MGTGVLPFRVHNMVQPFLHLHNRQRGEPEPGATALNGRRDLVDIIANDAKADVLRVLFDDATECSLGGIRHHVSFVENDEFVALREERSRFCKLLDLLTNDVDASIVGCIQLHGVKCLVWAGCKFGLPRVSAFDIQRHICVAQLQVS